MLSGGPGHVLVLPFFFVSITLFAYVVIGSFDRVIRRYKDTYVKSVEMNLRTLVILFDSEDIFTLGIVLGAVGGLISFFLFGHNLIIAGIGAIVFFYLPKWYLRWARQKRTELLIQQLVDGLTLISNSLRAGQSMPQAFGLITEEMSVPISQEFGILLKEYDLGTPLERCLLNMADRIKSAELEMFVNSVVICSRAGGNVIETFENIASMIRERIRLEGKIQSMTAEGRSQGLVLTLMPVLLGLAFYWVDPTMIRLLFDTVPGKIVLFGIIALDLSAWFITRKIMDIDI